MRAHGGSADSRHVGLRDLLRDRTELSGEVVSSPPSEGTKQGGRPLAGRLD